MALLCFGLVFSKLWHRDSIGNSEMLTYQRPFPTSLSPFISDVHKQLNEDKST